MRLARFPEFAGARTLWRRSYPCRRPHAGLWAAGALCVAGTLYATIGGFGAIVGRLLLPEIRGLNRISVFIGFFALYAFFVAVGAWLLAMAASLLRQPRMAAGVTFGAIAGALFLVHPRGLVTATAVLAVLSLAAVRLRRIRPAMVLAWVMCRRRKISVP